MSTLLHDLLLRSAAEQPDQPALVDGDRVTSYAELESASARIAATLQAIGVTRGQRVGLYLDKSTEAVAAIYGILRAGAAYVPLDPKSPVTRLGYIAANCGVEILITASNKARRWPEFATHGAAIRQLLVLDATTVPEAPPGIAVTTASELSSGTLEPVPVSADDLAYILYTSGSTGEPKGVMLSHRNGRAFVDWAAAAVGLRSTDQLSSHAPFHFDLSIFDLYAAAAAGATLHLVPAKVSVFPAEVIRFIDEHRLSVWYSVPSVLSMLVTHGGLSTGALSSLRTVIFAGEVFPSPYLTTLMELLPHVTFWNWYGPTETNVCTAYQVPGPPGPESPPIPIGEPIDGVRTAVLTDDGRVAQRGETGELLVAGPTVTAGYWGDDEKTAARLSPLPGQGEGPWYHTGDLVEELPEGGYRLLGRRDHQIKTRGYRVEIGEIEAALHRHPGVRECVVIAVADPTVTNRLCAYVVAPDLDERQLARHCATQLPQYMVPEHFTLRDDLPRTSTGKTDRVTLQRDAEQPRA